MSVRPLISIRAGKCTQNGTTITPNPEPGLLYLYVSPDDEMLHFCWKPTSAPEPEDDLYIFAGEASFVPYEEAKTGRIFILRFSSSSQRHFFWLQAQSERENEPGFWSERDRKWGRKIDRILQAGGDEGIDEEMGDAPADSGTVEEEGAESRRGGEDGGRAQDFASGNIDLQALLSGIQIPGAVQQQQVPTMSLHDLLSSQTTKPLLSNISQTTIDTLLSNLPPGIVPKDASVAQKKEVISKVFSSPQFTQSLVSLTVALREGGLRGIADSLRVPIAPGEEASGDMVEVFVKGVRREVESESESSRNRFGAAEDAPSNSGDRPLGGL